MSDMLCKLYLELANVVPQDCISARELHLKTIIDKYGLALMMIAEGATEPRAYAKDVLSRAKP